MTSDVKHIFTCFIDIYVSFACVTKYFIFQNCVLSPLLIYKSFHVSQVLSYIYVSVNSSLIFDVPFDNHFSEFQRAELFHFDKFQFTISSFCLFIIVHLCPMTSLLQHCKDFSPVFSSGNYVVFILRY